MRGTAILYADKVTGSMERAISETERRRARQIEHNRENGITPKTINKKIADVMEGARSKVSAKAKNKKKSASTRPIALIDNPKALGKRIKDLEKKMYQHAQNLEFEEAAMLRDELEELKTLSLR